MTTVRMDMRQWTDWAKKLGPRLKPAVLRGIESGALRCVALMQQRTMTAPPASEPNGARGALDTGLYKTAWKHSVLPDGARVYNDRPYAGVVDLGRRPGRAVGPAGRRNIALWARRKLHLSPGKAHAASWAIAQAIRNRGLKPRKVMSGALAEMTKLVNDEIKHELDAELSRGG